jgi:hypothetical protein
VKDDCQLPNESESLKERTIALEYFHCLITDNSDLYKLGKYLLLGKYENKKMAKI